MTVDACHENESFCATRQLQSYFPKLFYLCTIAHITMLYLLILTNSHNHYAIWHNYYYGMQLGRGCPRDVDSNPAYGISCGNSAWCSE